MSLPEFNARATLDAALCLSLRSPRRARRLALDAARLAGLARNPRLVWEAVTLAGTV